MENYIALKKYNLICASGKDIESFLQGQMTADIHKLDQIRQPGGDQDPENSAPPSSGLTQGSSPVANGLRPIVLTATCNIKGRVIANYWLWKKGESYYFLCPASTSALLLNQFKKYQLRADITFQPCEEYLVLGVMSENTPPDFPKILYHWKTVNEDSVVIAIPGDPSPRYILIVPKAAAQALTISHDTHQWEAQNITTHLAEIQSDTSGLFIPQMLSLEKHQGMSFEKGCYLGQEIIARLHFKGKLKRHLYQAIISSGDTPKNLPPKPGDKIYYQENDKAIEVGTVLQETTLKDGNISLLVVLEDRYTEKALYMLPDIPVILSPSSTVL